jgi:hypothetical protein
MRKPSKRQLVIGSTALATLIAIVLWMMSLVTHGWRTEAEWRHAYIEHSVLELNLAAAAIEQFLQQQGRLPRSLSELEGRSFVDAWGRELVFRPENAEVFILFSKGPDGIAGTMDDVLLPESSSRAGRAQNRGNR